MLTTVHNVIIHHYTICIVILGTCLIGITAGIVGVFALLRKQSLLGDAISHAALPGIALAFLLTYSKNPVLLLAGGAISGCIGTACTIVITQTTRLKLDTTLGMILSVFFGCGLILITALQKLPIAEQGILTKFIFGNASTLLLSDICVVSTVCIIILGTLFLFWKEFSLISFDAQFAHTLGYPVMFLDCLLTGLLVLTICTGLQTIGVMLMSSMLIAPAAAARQWTNRLGSMIMLAATIGAGATLSGALISNCINHMPTGPTIVVLLSISVCISFCLAPQRTHL